MLSTTKLGTAKVLEWVGTIFQSSSEAHTCARTCTHKGAAIKANAKLWICMMANIKIYSNLSPPMLQCISWRATHSEASSAHSRSEPFPVDVHSTLLSPWTSPSLCRSSLISSPRCLFLSWESLNSCTRLAWKYQHSTRAISMEVWTNVGFPDVQMLASSSAGSHRTPCKWMCVKAGSV